MKRSPIVYLVLILVSTSFMVVLFLRYSGLELQLDTNKIIRHLLISQTYYKKLCELDRYERLFQLDRHIRYEDNTNVWITKRIEYT